MPILDLLIVLIERFGLMITAAFLIMAFGSIRNLDFRPISRKNTILLTLLFGGLGILGTYTGDAVHLSVANLRAMSVITGGLVGGPLVGAGAGFIAGLHRNVIDPSGFSALPCGLATFLEGTIAGFIAMRLKDPMHWKPAAIIALVGECFHMVLVLTLSRPFADAVALVKVIAVPMIAVNTAGAALFIHTVRLVGIHREKQDSSQAQHILAIADATVSHLRNGLSQETAGAVAALIYDRVRVAAVAITDSTRVLAHLGQGADHHRPGQHIVTSATRRVLEKAAPTFIRNQADIGCGHPKCPFTSAIVVPLKKGGRIVGTLKFYGTRKSELDNIRFEIAKGLAALFSTQLELEDIQVKERLLAREEIRRLQAQINPHFLFNALNTIASYCRTNSAQARELLQDLALFMRKNLHSGTGVVPLSEELEHVRSYLAIEQARYGGRITANINVDDACKDWLVPSFLIQPLVENGIRHGISGREEGGTVTLSAGVRDNELHIMVEDDGVGMALGRPDKLLASDGNGKCIGVANCNLRLKHIYGSNYGLQIQSSPDQGTLVALRIPQVTPLTA
ncbi:LytS/YhcK type 5TM receptor domain-containing protein [Desulfovibrio ferrophilus]|uniref:histidine kinase n=1 Tax=Desulfovibrio ferrophilus TaxID=241368 RepID=A0A2Z6AUD6_9BACT|nr:LytS/YhcK type 5TM receptor domain-containing protein [Desulfovibrio ferrophilus]BBD06844.1 signal transduction histidine kinase, LytS [Desulfovibrio ferrophilus]